MKYMTMVKSAESHGPPPKELIEAIFEMGQKATADGTLVLSGGLGRSAASARVRLEDGEITVQDGPFAESKELVGGFAIFEVNSKEEAIEKAREFLELHKKHWPGWEGESEVRPLDTELPGD
jgi:hypothetical protein